MNKVRKHLKNIAASITEVDYRVNCKAYAGSHSCNVVLTVSGMDDERTNAVIIKQVQENAMSSAIKAINLAELHISIAGLDYPAQCKGWVASVIWFSCVTELRKDPIRFDEWMEFYREWEPLYSPEYKDTAERNAMLYDLGLSEQWVSNCIATTPKINKKLIHAGLRRKK